MDIYKFLNSRDIAAHWKKIGYNPSPLEAAWVVWNGGSNTLKEKHEAYREIIRTTADCAIPASECSPAFMSLHNYLKRLMEIELRLISEFYKNDANAIYTYKIFYEVETESCFDNNPGFFHTFEEARESAYDDITCDEDPVKVFGEELGKLISFEDSPDVDFVRFTKSYIGSPERQIYVSFNSDFEIVSVEEDLILTDTEDIDVFRHEFMSMTHYFPTPFKKGDVVRVSLGKYVRSLWLGGTYTLTSGISKSRFGKGEIVHAYRYDCDGIVTNEHLYEYMNFEYVRTPIEEDDGMLFAISSYLKGEIDLGGLLSAYRNILCARDAKITKKSLFCTPGGRNFADVIDQGVSLLNKIYEKEENKV